MTAHFDPNFALLPVVPFPIAVVDPLLIRRDTRRKPFRVIDSVEAFATHIGVSALGGDDPVITRAPVDMVRVGVALQLVGETGAAKVAHVIEAIARRMAAEGFAGREVHEDASVGSFIGEGVSSGAAAVHVVRACTAFDDVAAMVAIKEIVAVAALQDVGPGVAPQVVVELAAGDVLNALDPVPHDVLGVRPVGVAVRPTRRVVPQGDTHPVDAAGGHETCVASVHPKRRIKGSRNRRRKALVGDRIGARASIDIVHDVSIIVSAGLQARRIAVLLHQEGIVAVFPETAVYAAVENDRVVSITTPHARHKAVTEPGVIVACASNQIVVTRTSN